MKRKYLRYIIYIIEIYILYSLEQVGGFSIFGARPLLVLPAFVSISLFEGKYAAMAFGFFSGFLIDLSFGGIFGINAFLLGIIGFVLANLFCYYLKANFLSSMAISGLISCVLLGVNLCVNFIFKGFGAAELVIRDYIKIVFMTVLLSLPIYLFGSYLTRENANEK